MAEDDLFDAALNLEADSQETGYAEGLTSGKEQGGWIPTGPSIKAHCGLQGWLRVDRRERSMVIV